MTQHAQIQSWENSSKEALDNIQLLLKPPVEPYEDYRKDFFKLASWIFENAGSYELSLPSSWENAKESPVRFNSFLIRLENAMLSQGGEILFAKTEKSGPFIALTDNERQIRKDMKNNRPALNIIEFHKDVDKFIKDSQDYKNNPPPFHPFRK